MTKIKTLEDLKKIKDSITAELVSVGKSHNVGVVTIRVAMATCGIASGAKSVAEFLRTEMDKRGIECNIIPTGCMGYCYAEPTIEVTLPGIEPVVFGYVDTGKADEIIEKYIKNGELVEGIIPVNYETLDN